MFEDALRRAAELDEFLERTGKPFGPLHGLPISIKEHIHCEKTPSTAGFIAWADEIEGKDALIVKILREAGAVFHVKTTNPQALMVCLHSPNDY
jgi:amidase